MAFVFDNTGGMGYENVVAVDPFANEPATFDQLADIMSRVSGIYQVNRLDGSSCPINLCSLFFGNKSLTFSDVGKFHYRPGS